jgi:aspartate kinase
MASIIVSKFGGTSMGDASCMLRSAKIAVDQKSFIVVVSAVSGVTNQLIKLASASQNSNWQIAQDILNDLKLTHEKISLALQIQKQDPLNANLEQLVDELHSIAKGIHLLKDCSPKAFDHLLSFGERLSSVLFTKAMRSALTEQGQNKMVTLLDAREILKTDDHFSKAKPLTDRIQELAKIHLPQSLSSAKVFVTQGFIGSTEDGVTTTLGRGGSDYSAAIFAEAVGADILEIWTDVAGIATTDPRICKDARMIPEISFQEASELATFGAKVLHPSTLVPAVRKNIPVLVASSFHPEQKGTWIRAQVSEQPLVRAMALRKKQVLVTLSTPEMLQAPGFLFQIFKVFNDHKVSVDAITTSEISVSMTLDQTALDDKKLIQELSRFAAVQVEENLCLISVIGNNINHTPGLAKKIFDAVAHINVRMICLGASKHNFCFLVSDEKGAEAIQKLHQTFVN